MGSEEKAQPEGVARADSLSKQAAEPVEEAARNLGHGRLVAVAGGFGAGAEGLLDDGPAAAPEGDRPPRVPVNGGQDDAGRRRERLGGGAPHGGLHDRRPDRQGRPRPPGTDGG